MERSSAFQAADRDVAFFADMIIAGRAHDLQLGDVLPCFFKNDFSPAMRVGVTGAFIAMRRIGGEEGDLRVEEVEDESSLLAQVVFYALEELTESGCVAEELQRIEWHYYQREAPAEVERAAVSFNPGDADALALRLPPGLLQHGSRDVEAGDIGTRRRQRNRHPSRSATNLQYRSRRCLRLSQVERNIVLGFERVVLASIPNEIVVRHVFLGYERDL